MLVGLQDKTVTSQREKKTSLKMNSLFNLCCLSVYNMCTTSFGVQAYNSMDVGSLNGQKNQKQKHNHTQ